MALKSLLGWLWNLPGKLKDKNTEEVKLIISEVKDLRDYYRTEFKDLLEINKQREKQIQHLQNQINEQTQQMKHLQEMEERCLLGQAQMRDMYRDVRERLIMITKGKPDEDNKDPSTGKVLGSKLYEYWKVPNFP